MRPTIVRETRDASGRVVLTHRPAAPVRVLAAEIARSTTELLAGVVEEGTGVAAKVAGFPIAGKTGTAQKPVAGSYSAGVHAPWFAGYFPIARPELVIVVCVDEPRTSFWASDVAAPTVGRMVARLAGLLGIAPVPGVAV